MGLSLKFRDLLPQAVVSELDQLVSGVNGWLTQEHKDDGSHADVTADTVTLQGAQVGEMFDLAYTSTRFFAEGAAVWTVSSGNQLFFRGSRIGQMVFVEFNLQGTAIATDTPGSLFIRLPELHALPSRDSSGSPGYHVGGILNWTDIGGGTNGIGLVSAQAQSFSGGVPSTILQLDKCRDSSSASSMFGNWPISANLWIQGSIWFPVERDNVAVPYYGS